MRAVFGRNTNPNALTVADALVRPPRSWKRVSVTRETDEHPGEYSDIGDR
jgi:hypothetical protein